MNMNKAWMYNRLVNGFITDEYFNGVEEFVNFAKRHPKCMDGDKLRCPCSRPKCRNTTFRDEDTVKVHLGKYGFVPNYYNWYCHGEPYVNQFMGDIVASSSIPSTSVPTAREESSNDSPMEDILQRPSTSCELFHSTHQRKDGTFVDARSQITDDNITAKFAQASQPVVEGGKPKIPSHDEINNMYLEVVGGCKKNSIYGLGSQAKVIFPNVMRTTRLKGRASSSTEIALRKENQELRDRISTLEQSLANKDVTMEDMINAAVQRSMQDFISRLQLPSSFLRPSTGPDYSTSHGIDSQETHDP